MTAKELGKQAEEMAKQGAFAVIVQTPVGKFEGYHLDRQGSDLVIVTGNRLDQS